MHHYRRKSGSTSTTDVREQAKHSSKSTRPAPMTRRSTPQTALKLGKSPRDRERQWDEERWYEDERESFPQYCMACEKQLYLTMRTPSTAPKSADFMTRKAAAATLHQCAQVGKATAAAVTPRPRSTLSTVPVKRSPGTLSRALAVKAPKPLLPANATQLP